MCCVSVNNVQPGFFFPPFSLSLCFGWCYCICSYVDIFYFSVKNIVFVFWTYWFISLIVLWILNQCLLGFPYFRFLNTFCIWASLLITLLYMDVWSLSILLDIFPAFQNPNYWSMYQLYLYHQLPLFLRTIFLDSTFILVVIFFFCIISFADDI